MGEISASVGNHDENGKCPQWWCGLPYNASRLGFVRQRTQVSIEVAGSPANRTWRHASKGSAGYRFGNGYCIGNGYRFGNPCGTVSERFGNCLRIEQTLCPDGDGRPMRRSLAPSLSCITLESRESHDKYLTCNGAVTLQVRFGSLAVTVGKVSAHLFTVKRWLRPGEVPEAVSLHLQR